MRILRVTNQFGPYQIGDEIRDAKTIGEIMSDQRQTNVVGVEVDDPVEPAKPADPVEENEDKPARRTR